MLPKVSIILTVYNNEKTVEKCIRSLINQNYKNKELIIVDDGSKDNSISIVRKFKKLKLIRLRHKGRSHARNIGLKKSKGQFVFFAEADAYYSKNYVSTCVKKLLENPKIGGLIGRLLVWNKNKFLPKCKELEREYAIYTRKPKSGWFYRKDLIKDGFDEKLDFGEDIDLGNRVRRKGFLIEWCKTARWYHTEPETFFDEFKRNLGMGKSIVLMFRQNKKFAFVELIKSIFFPLLTLSFILSFFSFIFQTLFLFFFTIFLLKYFKFFLVALKLKYKIKYILLVPMIWFIRSFARFFGLFLRK